MFSLMVMAQQKGGVHKTRSIIKVAQDQFGYEPLRKRDDGGPGDHGIPEIGRQEQAFRDSLSGLQREAYDAVRSLVDQLYDRKGSWQGVDPWEVGTPVDEWKQRAFLELARHPMQAYLVGQMLASEALKEPLARPLLEGDRVAIERLQHETFNEIDSKFEDIKGDLRRELITGISDGLNPREVGRRIANTLKDYETQWDVVAITETARAESYGRLQEILDQGYLYAIGSSAHDSRVCPDCLRLIDGVVVKVSDTIGRSNYGRKRDDWISVIPLHPRCRCVWLPYVK